jgi:hypothetical protein
MNMSDGDILGQCEEFLQAVKSSTVRSKRLEYATINRDFYRGAQWGETDWNEYKAKGVEPITVNRCLSTVNNISGMQRKNRQDIAVRPRRGGKEVVANIYTELLKHAIDQSNGEFVFSECFRDGLHCIESFLFADVDEYAASPGGQVVITNRTIFNTAIDPEAKEYDVNLSAKFAVLWDWMDKDMLALRFPDFVTFLGRRNDTGQGKRFMTYMLGGMPDTVDELDGSDIETENRVKVFRFFWWEACKAARIINKKDGSVVVVTDEETLKKMEGKSSRQFDVREVPGRRLHRSTICNDILLVDDIDPYHWRTGMMPLSRFSPYWNDGDSFGVLDNIRSLNYEENVHRTNITRHLNQTVNSGWKVARSTEASRKKLEQFGSVNGIVIDESEYGGKVEKIEPNSLPSGHMILAQQFAQDIKEVSAINDAMQGYDAGREESGRAMNMKMQQGATTTGPVFDAFDATLRVFGNFLLRITQNTEVYTDTEITEIIKESDMLDADTMAEADNELSSKIGGSLPAPTNPQVLAGSPEQLAAVRPEDQQRVMMNMQMGVQSASMYAEQFPALLEKWTQLIEHLAAQKMLKSLKDSRVSDYWVKVTLSPISDTVRMANLMELNQIAQMYPGSIPPDIMVDATDVKNKEEIKTRLRQQPQAPAVAATGAPAQ